MIMTKVVVGLNQVFIVFNGRGIIMDKFLQAIVYIWYHKATQCIPVTSAPKNNNTNL